MVEHGRASAFEGFEQALALSPSSSFALFLGCVASAWAGEAERAIEWAARTLRISPFDRLNYCSHIGFAVSHFLSGRYEEAANAGRRAVQSNPGFSSCHGLLAAALAKLGRLEEAKAAATRVLALQPTFSASGFCTALALLHAGQGTDGRLSQRRSAFIKRPHERPFSCICCTGSRQKIGTQR
jgi:adenylate cyclase